MKVYNFLKPYRFKNGLMVKNRIVMSPMSTVSSFYSGHVTTDEINYYRLRTGGAGSIESDIFIPDIEKIANAIKIKETKAILQLFHAGRMSNSKFLHGEQTVSASAIASKRKKTETPRELREDEIIELIEEYGEATRRAIEAGFDGVELHGANGYLLQQFVSTHSNKRTDKWGGSFENRLRFPLAVIRKVEDVIHKYSNHPFILGYRLSPKEVVGESFPIIGVVSNST